MSVDLGTKTITGDAEERTWRVTIETPATGHADPLTGYKFIVHREEAIFDAQNAVLDQVPGAKYEFTDVDLLEGMDKIRAVNELRKINPSCSFPTIIIGEKIIVGNRSQEIKEALGLS